MTASADTHLIDDGGEGRESPDEASDFFILWDHGDWKLVWKPLGKTMHVCVDC